MATQLSPMALTEARIIGVDATSAYVVVDLGDRQRFVRVELAGGTVTVVADGLPKDTPLNTSLSGGSIYFAQIVPGMTGAWQMWKVAASATMGTASMVGMARIGTCLLGTFPTQVKPAGIACTGGVMRLLSSPGWFPSPGPRRIRTWRFPPSGSSADVSCGFRVISHLSRC